MVNDGESCSTCRRRGAGRAACGAGAGRRARCWRRPASASDRDGLRDARRRTSSNAAFNRCIAATSPPWSGCSSNAKPTTASRTSARLAVGSRPSTANGSSFATSPDTRRGNVGLAGGLRSSTYANGRCASTRASTLGCTGVEAAESPTLRHGVVRLTPSPPPRPARRRPRRRTVGVGDRHRQVAQRGEDRADRRAARSPTGQHHRVDRGVSPQRVQRVEHAAHHALDGGTRRTARARHIAAQPAQARRLPLADWACARRRSTAAAPGRPCRTGATAPGGRTRRDRPPTAGARHRSPWSRSACTPAAGTDRSRRRTRPLPRWHRRTPTVDTVNAVPDVPERHHRLPGTAAPARVRPPCCRPYRRPRCAPPTGRPPRRARRLGAPPSTSRARPSMIASTSHRYSPVAGDQ